MIEERHLTCINCPLGCQLTVSLEDGRVTSVSGNTCPRGDDYGHKEVTHPTRIVCSSVRVTGGDMDMVSVKTANDIPKEKIFDICRAMRDVQVTAPVHIGDVILPDICGTGVNLVATREVNLSSGNR